jgi:hypothetical protein
MTQAVVLDLASGLRVRRREKGTARSGGEVTAAAMCADRRVFDCNKSCNLTRPAFLTSVNGLDQIQLRILFTTARPKNKDCKQK